MNIEPKKIAEILSKHIDDFGVAEGTVLCNRFVELFEREDKACHICGKPMKIKEIDEGIYTHYKECKKCNTGAYVSDLFNPEEFKKQCGVE